MDELWFCDAKIAFINETRCGKCRIDVKSLKNKCEKYTYLNSTSILFGVFIGFL